VPVDSNGGYHNPICDKSLEAFSGLLKVIDELEKAKTRRGYLRNMIQKAQDELKKEYGEGYITRKKVRDYRFPIFRSFEKGKDYNLERNFPELAEGVNEYFAVRKRIKELEATRKKLGTFINRAYVACVPWEVRDPKRAYKERQIMKAIFQLSEFEDSLQEQCEDGDNEACKQLEQLQECGEYRIEGKRIICD